MIGTSFIILLLFLATSMMFGFVFNKKQAEAGKEVDLETDPT